MPNYSPKPSAVGYDVSGDPADRYRIVGRIAAGGMAEIYLARTTSKAGVEREVVLKRLLPELQSDQEFVQMFHDEARIASQLNHPNIVQIYELGELDGSLFIAMELIRGVNLRDLLARLHTANKQLPIPMAVRIACEALEGLNYAHGFVDGRGKRLNVVHRDVSPQNMIITYEGSVKLVDFGVAKAEGKLHQTRAGLVKGKFAYMSPEQITGSPVDGRSDLFALAEVFYELLVRRHPFYASTDMDVLRSILDADPPHPSAIAADFPRGLGDIFMRALKKKPGDRYPDAAAMQESLEHFLLDQRTPATTIMLGRFVRELFGDRMAVEQKARERADDDLLIEAMTAGRAEYIKSLGKGAIPRPSSSGAEPAEEPTEGGRRPRRDPAVLQNDTTGGRIRNEVRGLFDADSEPTAATTGDLDSRLDDAAEMPTLMGAFSKQQLEEIRGHAEATRKKNVDDVAVVPADRKMPPVITRAPVDPADTTGERAAPMDLTPVGPPAPAPVTARSATTMSSHQPPVDPGKRSDRLGIFFFVAGLGALVGAIIYAFILLGPSRATVALKLVTKPEGAAIILDGHDTGARTPVTIPAVAADRPHEVELRLDGFVPHHTTVTPKSDEGETVVEWSFGP
ncbi:MAG: serine/threonine-protein kinase [Myxococcota bacterium]